MRCRHSTTRRMWRLGESWCGWVAAVRAGRSWDEFGARICNHCGTWLPLGPSNDEPEAVRVEIRAAEIARCLDEGGCEMSSLECCGFNDEWPTLRGGGHVHMDTASQRAGYLAREIATHSEES